MPEVKIDGVHYAPVNQEDAKAIAERLRTFTLEGSTHWRRVFIENDTDKCTAQRYGIYSDGDENAPFFSEAFLYNLLGKNEARSVLSIMRRLCTLAGVEWR